jgi:hypothetical protein
MAFLIVPVLAGAGVLAIPVSEGSSGSELTVPVTAEDFSGIGAILFDITYGNHMLSYVGAEPGTLIPDAVIEAREINPGVVEVGILDSKGITGSGTIMSLKFRVNDGLQYGSSLMTPAVVEAFDTSGNPVQIETRRGVVTISGSAMTKSSVPITTASTTKASLEPLIVLIAALAGVLVYPIKKRK